MNQKELDALEKVLNNYFISEHIHHKLNAKCNDPRKCKHIHHSLETLNNCLNRIKRLNRGTYN